MIGYCLRDQFGAGAKAEHAVGSPTAGITRFKSFFERFKDSLTFLGDRPGVVSVSHVLHTNIADEALSGVQGDDLILSIAKHCILLKKVRPATGCDRPYALRYAVRLVSGELANRDSSRFDSNA